MNNKLSRIIAILLAYAIIFTMSTSLLVFADEVSTEAAETAPVESVQEIDYTKELKELESLTEELDILRALNVVDEIGKEDILTDVTRAEFTRFALGLLNVVPKITTEEMNYFSDVTVEHPYYYYINGAASAGLVNGYGDGSFHPDEPIKFAEAIKVIVGCVNYHDLAEANGGYPAGYINTARKIGLIDGLRNADSVIKTNEIVRVLYNALFVEMPTNIIYADGSVLYEPNETYLYLEYMFGTLRYQGVVSDVPHSLRLKGVAEYNKIIVDDKEYDFDNRNNIDELSVLGAKCYYYVQYEDGRRKAENCEVICVGFEPSKNNILYLDSEDIVSCSDEFKLVYFDKNDKKKSTDLSDAIYYYNGRIDLEGAVTPEDFVPEYGSVKLVDNNRDGEYDFAFIEDIREYVVDYTATKYYDGETINIIGVKYGTGYYDAEDPFIKTSDYGEHYLEINNTDESFLIYRDNVLIDIDYVGEWETLAFKPCKPVDGVIKGGTLVFHFETVVGDVGKSDEDTIKIGKNKIDKAAIYKEALENDNPEANDPYKINTVKFGLNARGEVVCCYGTVATLVNYGWLIRVGQDKGFNAKPQLKLLPSSGDVAIFNVTDNLKVNGRTYKGRLEEYFTDVSGNFVPQLIKYVYKDSVISKIFTLNDEDSVNADKTFGPGNNTDLTLDYYNTSGSWSYGNSLIDNQIYTNGPDYPIFWIPYDESSDEDYHSYTKASIGSINRSTKFYAYDITVMNNGVSDADKVYAPGAIVVKQSTRPEEVFKPGSSNPYNLNSIPETFNFINAANGHQRSHRNTLIIKEVEELVDTDGSTYFKFTFGENLGDGDEFAVRVKEGAYNADTTNSFGYGFIDSPSGIQKGDLVGFGLAPNETDLADRFVIYATKDEYKDIDWSETNLGFSLSTAKFVPKSDRYLTAFSQCGTQACLLKGRVIYKNGNTIIVKTKFGGVETNVTFTNGFGVVYLYDAAKNSLKLFSAKDSIVAGEEILMVGPIGGTYQPNVIVYQ